MAHKALNSQAIRDWRNAGKTHKIQGFHDNDNKACQVLG